MRARPTSLMTFVVAAVMTACSPSPAAVTADLCTDLDRLAGTVGFIVRPPEGATVGQVRSAVDKLDPTFTRVEDGGSVPGWLAARLVSAQRAYREVLRPFGDDEPATVLAVGISQPSRRLEDALDAVELQLSC